MTESITKLETPPVMKDLRYWGHTKNINNTRLNETLLEHAQLTLHYYDLNCKHKQIDQIVKNIIAACGFSGLEAERVYLEFVYAIYLHDFGKINPCYQYEVLKNDEFRNIKRLAGNNHHSMASAFLYLDFMYNMWPEKPTPANIKCLAAFAYCISKHHGNLGDGHEFYELESFDEQYCKFVNMDSDIIENISYYMQQPTADPIAFYILCRLLFSLIVGCDYSATQEFMTGSSMEPAVIRNGGRELLLNYKQSENHQSVRQYQQNPANFQGKPINALRNELFLEAEQSLLANPTTNIYYLEAPTGAGKTNIAINLALQALQIDERINNIFYVFPFNTLIEQTRNVMYPLFGDNLAIINSVTPIDVNEDDRLQNHDEVWLDHVFNNYPIVLTSHVNYFNALFGCGRRQIFPLVKLCNSVIVIDEIQSYKNKIWREIISFLQKYATLLNMKIIIMSATLPQLDKLLNNVEARFTSLINNPATYYHNPLFRNRVRLDFSLLERGKITLEYLKIEVLKFTGKSVLVEFIKKSTARSFYMMCREENNVVLLTGDDNTIRRNEIIQRILNGEKLILITTQVIETGIDIDMEVGFKDISLPDSEEQFIGRLNRSCLNPDGALACFFDYDDADGIYKGDARLRYSIINKGIRTLFKEKRFTELYMKIFADLISSTSKPNTKNIINLHKNCGQLNYLTIEQQMQLIDPNRQMFVPYICTWGKEELDGYKVWEQFKEIGNNKELTYPQRMVAYSKLALQMSYFTFNVYRDKTPNGIQEYGGYYFIDGGERFVEDGILNREALEKYYGGMFL